MYENFSNGTEPVNPTELATRQMLLLGNELHGLSQTVMANNRYMADVVQSEIAKVERERRKRRKREICSWVAVVNDSFSLVKKYDDGTESSEKLTLNLTPNFQIFRFKLRGVEEKCICVGLYFKCEDFWLIEEERKITGRKIYEGLIRNGVIFNGGISRNKIQEILYGFFVPKIREAGTLQISALAGWFCQKFLSSETFWFQESEGFLELPIRKKYFRDYTGKPLCVENYFSEIKEIEDWRNRVWCMIYPIGGMFSSLLSEVGITPAKYLNLVNFADVPIRKLHKYFRVFNRNKWGEGKCDIEGILSIKDEVVMLDAYGWEKSEYRKKRKREICQNIAERVVEGEMITEDGIRINSPVVIISDRIMRTEQTVNLYLDENFYTVQKNRRKEISSEDEIGKMFFHIVKHFELNYGELDCIFSEGEKIDFEIRWIFCTYRICQKFWESLGVNMQKMAGLPEKIDFQELFRDELYFEDDLIIDFVKIVRKEIQKWRVIPKNQGRGTGEEVIYNEDFIWLPVKVLNDMLSNFGILDQKVQFLEKLKAENQMVTDEKGISRKVQVAGKRYEAYQFRRTLFYIPGAVDIVELGKEDTNAER